jgi:phosphoglycolate phosphatase
MPAPTIVFDLDGTLIDTAPDLIDTLNVILTRHDVAPVAFDEARTMIGAGVKPLLHAGGRCGRSSVTTASMCSRAQQHHHRRPG